MSGHDHDDGSIGLADWLDRLRAHLVPLDRRPPHDGGTAGVANLDLTPGEQAALLDLTRVAAHRSERIAAPLSAFVVGAAFAHLPSDERERRVRELTARFEAEVEREAGGTKR